MNHLSTIAVDTATTCITVIGKEGTGKTWLLEKLAELCLPAYENNIVWTNGKLDLANDDGHIEISEMSLTNPLNLSCLQNNTKMADAFVIVYGIDDYESFDFVGRIKDFIRAQTGDSATILVIGNKCDIANRMVPFAIADCMVSIEWEMKYLEVSAATGENVKKIMPILVKHMEQNFDEIETYELNGVTIRRRKSNLSRSKSVNIKHLFPRSPSPTKTEPQEKENKERTGRFWFSFRSPSNSVSSHRPTTRSKLQRRRSSLAQLLVCIDNHAESK